MIDFEQLAREAGIRDAQGRSAAARAFSAVVILAALALMAALLIVVEVIKCAS